MANEDNNYLMEALTHERNLTFLGAAAAVGVALSFVNFGAGLVLGLCLAAVGETLVALTVPSLSTFIAYVDNKKAGAHREAMRERFVTELKISCGRNEENWNRYLRMCDLAKSIREMAINGKLHADNEDLMRFDDAPVSFLGLWLSRVMLDKRQASLDVKKMKSDLDQATAMLATADSVSVRQSLTKTQTDLRRLLQTSTTISAQISAADASLLTMRDAMEEIYLGALAGSSTAAVSDKLKQAVDEMRIAESLSDDGNLDIDALFNSNATVAKKATAISVPQSAAVASRRVPGKAV